MSGESKLLPDQRQVLVCGNLDWDGINSCFGAIHGMVRVVLGNNHLCKLLHGVGLEVWFFEQKQKLLGLWCLRLGIKRIKMGQMVGEWKRTLGLNMLELGFGFGE